MQSLQKKKARIEGTLVPFMNMVSKLEYLEESSLMLEEEVPCWREAQLAETWETMRYYILGSPHGSRSSLFVNQETGQALKNIWKALIHTGMFGPIKV